jgi:hypothetical protein
LAYQSPCHVVQQWRTSIEEPTYIVEWGGTESRLPNAGAVSEVLTNAASAESAELWVYLDRGPRRRTRLGHLFGSPARNIEPCFWLAKAGDVAALTFLDRAWSEYRATDPSGHTEATEAQRMALSCGEPTPAPPEMCLQADRAFAAAAEYLERGRRPDWLVYRYVR